MRRRLALAALAALLAGTLAGGRGRAAGVVSVLRATPSQGHSGSLIDLSGYGLPPHTRLFIMMACPNWADPSVVRYQNLEILPPSQGPKTDADGQFSGFLMRAIRLHHFPSSGCEFYAAYDHVQYGPDIPATYTIVPSDRQLPRCSRSMCVKVRAAPRRVRTGLTEHISVRGWPGARVNINLGYPGNAHVARVTHLDWKGRATFNVPIHGNVSSQTSVRVTARAQLGPQQGTDSTNFTIFR